MNVFHVVPTLHPRAGGPSRTVVQLVDALALEDDIKLSLITQSYSHELSVLSRDESVNRIVCRSDFKLALGFGIPLLKALFSHCDKSNPSLIHSHGIWLPANHWPAALSGKYNIPYIVQPRGMLEPWAMKHKPWKKKIAMALFQQRDLELAKVIVATSDAERLNIRNLGFKKPIAVIPNGVDIDHEISSSQALKPAGRINTVLFLSRIHQKKGLMNLVRAWAKLQPEGWRLQIAGPDEGGHLAEVMAAARKACVDSAIDYIGEVDGAEKAAVYQNADLFVLPTFSENFGVVVAEALSHGLPVITTRGAPWADLETYHCGWWVEIGVEPLLTALGQAIALSDGERRAMGKRGRAYVQKYNWPYLANQTADVYRWVLGQAEKPDCVHLD